MPRNSIEINNSEDYCAWASDVLSEMTGSIIGDERYTSPVTEDDLEIVEDHWTHIFTKRGQNMVINWHRRLVALGEAKFPDDEMEIENWHYLEG